MNKNVENYSWPPYPSQNPLCQIAWHQVAIFNAIDIQKPLAS